jgi:hypothetical protein
LRNGGELVFHRSSERQDHVEHLLAVAWLLHVGDLAAANDEPECWKQLAIALALKHVQGFDLHQIECGGLAYQENGSCSHAGGAC